MTREWWRDAVVYQIYPRSFQDSNADGIGDLEGIISRLDYLNDGTEDSLGIDAIWLSPTFPSPMKDFGYDVSDYRDVHPDFGALETMDRLIQECHRRNIRILLDWVPNHTSDQHPWFLESRSSRDNPKRDWYCWRPAKPDGSLPNNWRGAFGGAAWTLDEKTGEYYLHSFLKEQPDLNWRNPEVERAMMDVLRFWFERGIDGFRIDVVGMIIKHPDLADNPPNPEWKPGDRERYSVLWVNNRNYSEVYDAVKRIRATFDEYPEKMAVGEVFGTAREISGYYGETNHPGLHLAFNFQFIHEDDVHRTPWDAETMKRIVRNAEAAIPPGSQPCFAFANHDRARFISRHNEDGRGLERARAAALLLLSLHSTPFMYYGEEIGMEDNDEIPEDRLQDPARFRSIGRDPERTPMQWNASQGRGFTSAEPWLPFGRKDRNVEDQTSDPSSMVALYRRALWFRKRTPALCAGGYRELESPDGSWLFERSSKASPSAYFALNTTLQAIRIDLPQPACVEVATHIGLESNIPVPSLELPPLGAAILVAD
ncbi:MAG: alpha-amylase family glycosyl hydrolase [Dehalococcoidia bacterium]